VQRLFAAAWIFVLAFALASGARADPIDCVWVPPLNAWVCADDGRPVAPTPPPPTQQPTALPTALPPTPPPPTSGPAATATPVPTPTAPATNVRPFPAPGADGRISITQAGVYSGNVSCGPITGGDYCLNVLASPVTLQDFTLTANSAFGSILTSSNATFLRGTINGRGGITGYRVQNILVDGVTFNVSVGAFGIYDQGGDCEGLPTKRTQNIVIQNSVINSTSTASETGWFKCAQGVKILNNRWYTTAEWSLSFPDALDVEIRGNSFDLSPEPKNWLAIELPRTFRILVEGNVTSGPVGDWFVWVNSGTNFLDMKNNCVRGGAGLLNGSVPNGSQSGNGPCPTLFTPPGTGNAGLKR